ncbi:phage tail protein [Proteus penneri]|uniref:phage tail protein n=1 Tax=Proteus penneri TaxID=102862 RepID=UPI00224644BE|nr:phage tail protein [Proteus penneri]MCX2589737.1 phage tail protein [Proteus penneri]
MSVIKKPDLKIFAQDAKTGEIETFPDVLRGWGVTLERTAGKPPLEWFNAIGKRVDEWLMYLTQRGLAEWDDAVDYPKDALVQHSSVFYVALKVTKGEQPNTSQNAWKPLADFLGVNNKLDKTAVVQSPGASTTSVMSQKASTDAFQPKGIYPTTSEMNVELNKKIDKANISQQLANDVNKVPSLDLVTKELGKKQPAGNYQPKGNYADKESPSSQVFAGKVIGSDEVIAKYGLISLAIKTSSGYPEIASSIDSHNYHSIKMPNSSGVMALRGDSYTKSESDDKYQPIGHYASAGASYTKAESDGRYQKIGFYANKESEQNQVFNSKLIAKNEVAVSSNKISLAIKTANNYPEIVSSLNLKDYFSMKLQNKSGTVALLSDIDEVNNIPVGSPIPWSLPTAPSGYLICQGQTFNKSTYPKLAIAYPSGRLPELRSEFIRGADAGRGIDTGREVLSSQSGNSLLSARGMGGNSEFSLKMSSGSVGTDNQGQREIYQQIEGQNGNETRPRNIAFLYIVRAA